MSYEPPFAGYPGTVFAACWQASAWLGALLQGGAAPVASIAQGAVATFQTFSNGADAVAAWQAAVALGQEQLNMTALAAVPLGLDPVTQSYFNARGASGAAARAGWPPSPRQ